MIITKQEHLCGFGLDVYLIKVDKCLKNMDYSERVKYLEKILKDNNKINFKKYTINTRLENFKDKLFDVNVWDDSYD